MIDRNQTYLLAYCVDYWWFVVVRNFQSELLHFLGGIECFVVVWIYTHVVVKMGAKMAELVTTRVNERLWVLRYFWYLILHECIVTGVFHLDQLLHLLFFQLSLFAHLCIIFWAFLFVRENWIHMGSLIWRKGLLDETFETRILVKKKRFKTFPLGCVLPCRLSRSYWSILFHHLS